MQFDDANERALLSSILNYDSTIILAAEHVKPIYFINPINKLIFNTCISLACDDMQVNLITVSQALKGKVKPEYLSELLGIISSSTQVVQLARFMRDDYIKRTLSGIAKGIDDYQTGSEALAEVNRRLRDLEDSTFDQWKDDRLFTPESINQVIEDLKNPESMNRNIYQSGISQLDDIISGFQVATTTAIQGLYFTGKTKFLISILAHHAKKGVPVGFLSLDMSKRRVRNWFLSHWCKIDSKFFISPYHSRWDSILGGTGGMTLRDSYFQDILAAKSDLVNLRIHCLDPRRPSVDDVAAMSARWAREGVRLIGLDYFERMQTGREWKDEGEVTARLSDIAKTNDIAFIYVDQLSKTAEHSKRPSLSDSRGSISRNADADLVLQLRNSKRFGGKQADETADHIADIEVLIVGREAESGKIIKIRGDMRTGHFAGIENS
jgi:replicative DNA helicase